MIACQWRSRWGKKREVERKHIITMRGNKNADLQEAVVEKDPNLNKKQEKQIQRGTNIGD